MRKTAVHKSGSRLECARLAEGGPHEQHRIDTTIHRGCRGDTSCALLRDSQESQPLDLAQTLALRACQVRLTQQHMCGNRALEATYAGWQG